MRNGTKFHQNLQNYIIQNCMMEILLFQKGSSIGSYKHPRFQDYKLVTSGSFMSTDKSVSQIC